MWLNSLRQRLGFSRRTSVTTRRPQSAARRGPTVLPGLRLETLDDRLTPSVTVTTILDVSSNIPGVVSLRNAVAMVDAGQVPDNTIILPANANAYSTANAGPLNITHDLILQGAGAGTTTIDAGGASGVFLIDPTSAVNVQISGVTIQNGSTPDEGGGIEVLDATGQASSLTVDNSIISDNHATLGGGGIFLNNGNLTLTASEVTGNTISNNSGGGISSIGTGTITATNSLIQNNTAQVNGGGIYVPLGGLDITGSQVSHNTATVGSGGAIYDSGSTLTITTSTFDHNTAFVNGGGIEVETTGTGQGASSITDSTVADNANTQLISGLGGIGGGIDFGNAAGSYTGTTTLEDDTITGNSAYSAGGIGIAHGGVANVQNSIIALNTVANAGPDFANTNGFHFTDLGGNIIGINLTGFFGGSFTQSSDQIGTSASPINPLLGALTNNGGPLAGPMNAQLTVQTELPQTGSPAIGKGLLPGATPLDERGFLRPAYILAVAPDVGAVDSGGTSPQTLSTVPTSGDVNPYGVGFVPADFPTGGTIQPGDLLVSNFNNSGNTQGTGTTLVRISPTGTPTTVFTSTQLGLDAALGFLKAGYVLVGNVPNTDGQGTPGAGAIQVLDNHGNLVTTITDSTLLDGPWYLTVANDTGSTAQVFVSNVLSGTVTRLDLAIGNGTVTVTSKTEIGGGYGTLVNPNVFVAGPAGLAYDSATGTLYVASEVDDTIYSIANASTIGTTTTPGTVVQNDPTHLHGPLGLLLAPNGNLLVANADSVNVDPNQPSELVEYTLSGSTASQFVGEFPVDPNNGGAFGLGINVPASGGFQFAAVDDNGPNLSLWGTQSLPARSIVTGLTPQLDSTVPSNGDVNPYGVGFVPSTFQTGRAIQPGDLLVSNFNNSGNTQGTGTTLVRITPNGTPATVFTSTQMGLDAALGFLKAGYVLVGNVPNTDGQGTPGAGSIQVIDTNGNLVTTITDNTLLDGPWYLTVANDTGSTAELFVSNVLSGTVTRLELVIGNGTVTVTSKVQIASGYGTLVNPSVFVAGPSGLAYNAASDTLYVASEVDDAIYSIANASTATDTGKGTLVVQDATHLHGSLGLVLAPNGDLIVANADSVNVDANQPSEIVEYTTAGQFVTQFSVDPNNGGAFGLGINTANGLFQFAAVDDNVPNISYWSTTALPTRTDSLALTVTPSAPSVTVGGNVSFTVSVTNTGTAGISSDTTAVTVTLPAGFTTTGPLTFTVGALPVGQSATFTVQATATSPGSQTVSATLTSPDTTPTTTGPVTTTVTVTPAVVTIQNQTQQPVVIGGEPNGAVSLFTQSLPGQYTPVGSVNPFPGVAGVDIRSAVGDVNGDGIPDEIYVTGPGTLMQVTVISGANGSVLVPPFTPFAGFTGGGFVSVGDFLGNGRDQIVVTPDRSGGPRVAIYDFNGTSMADGTEVNPVNGLTRVANFFTLDPNFRGGARTAVGDLNGDGHPDLVVAAGFGGGPAIVVINGTRVIGTNGFTASDDLVGNFYAFSSSLRDGAYVAVGDVLGNGQQDLILGPGDGGPAEVEVLSGQQIVNEGAVAAIANPVALFTPTGLGSSGSGERVAVAASGVGDQVNVVVGAGKNMPGVVKVYPGTSFTNGMTTEPTGGQILNPYNGTALTDGIFVG